MSDTKSPRRADEVGNKAAGAAEKVYDAVVIGAGAGGLNAALVLARARCTVAVVDGGRPRNASAAHMRGFLSRDGMPPADLLEAGRAELTGYGADIFDNHIDRIAPGFFVHLSGGAALRARRIVVATGLRDQLPISPASANGGDAICCTARSATATRSATSRSAYWAPTPTRSTRRCCSSSGLLTSSTSRTPGH